MYLTSLVALSIIHISNANAVIVPNQECVLDAHHSNWTPLKKVAVMPEDARYGIVEGAAKIGLSDAETEWIRQVTGGVVCRDPKTKELTGGSGTLFGRNDQILTAAHVLLESGQPREDCYFVTKTEPPIWRRLLVSSKKTIFGTKDAEKETNNDVALVRLEEPLKNTKPVKILRNVKDLRQKDKLLLISSQMLRMKRLVGINEPVVQSCAVRHIDPIRSDANRLLYSDCSSTKSASGSMNFVRAKDGHLYGAGVLVTSGVEELDNLPYDYFTRNRTGSVVLDELFVTTFRKAGAAIP